MKIEQYKGSEYYDGEQSIKEASNTRKKEFERRVNEYEKEQTTNYPPIGFDLFDNMYLDN